MLIDRERDDEAILAAEDEAIRQAANPPVEPDIPVGDDLAALIARVTNATTNSGTEGGDRRPG